MKNKFLPLTVLSLVFVVAFNIVFYALMGTNNPASVWIAYVFVHISYVALLCTKKAVPPKNDADSFAYPLYTISATYFALTLVAAGVFMYLKQQSAAVCVVINVVLTALYMVIFIPHVMTGQKANQKDAGVETGRNLIDLCCVKIGNLKNKYSSNAQLFEKLCNTYDIIHSSSVKSNKFTESVEARIGDVINSINSDSTPEAIEKTMDNLLDLFKERQDLLRLNR